MRPRGLAERDRSRASLGVGQLDGVGTRAVPGRTTGSPDPLVEAQSLNDAQAHLDQNVLARYAVVAPASILGPLGGLFSAAVRPGQRPLPPIWRKRVPRKSRLETNTENEARSALLARLWCHLILQNSASRAENLTRLCSATIGQTEWRMVQFGAIRSRPKGVFSVYSVTPPLFRRAGSAAM